MPLGTATKLRWTSAEIEQNSSLQEFNDITDHSVEVLGDRLWVIGGSCSNVSEHSLVFRTINLNTFVWEDAAQYVVDGVLPDPRTRHGSFLKNDKIYMFGGVCFRGRLTNELWQYDTTLHQWTRCEQYGALPAATSFFAGHYIERKDSYVVFGGAALPTPLHGLNVLNVSAQTWHVPFTKGAAPLSSAATASTLEREQMYVFGGRSVNAAGSELYILDCSSSVFVWSKVDTGGPKACSPGTRYNASLTNCGGRLFLVGGRVHIHRADSSSDLYFFSLVDKQWHKADSPQRSPEIEVIGIRPLLVRHTATPVPAGLLLLGTGDQFGRYRTRLRSHFLVDAQN